MKYITIRKIAKHQHFWPIILLTLVTIIIFNGVLSGKLISNATYLYHFPPWRHLPDQPSTKGNNIMSDMVDGAGHLFAQVNEVRKGNIPLWDYSAQLGRPGFLNMLYQWNNPLKVFWVIFGSALGWTLEILVKFLTGGIFTYLYLRKLCIGRYVAVAVAIGFTFGANNIGAHQAGFSSVPLALAVVFYFLERLLQSNKWSDALLLIFAFIYYAGTGFVSVMYFGACWAIIYVLIRLIAQNKYSTMSIVLKLLFATIVAVLILFPFLFETLNYFGNGGINLSYRENYGIAQLKIESLLNIFSGNSFGHPLSDFHRWKFGSYINTGVFVGIISIFCAITFSILRLAKYRETITIFFFLSLIFMTLDIYRFPFENLEYFTNEIPGFHGNRPTYQKTIFQFFLAIFGALGLDYYWKNIFNESNSSIFSNYKYYWLVFVLIVFGFVSFLLFDLNMSIFSKPSHWKFYFLFMVISFLIFYCAVGFSFTMYFRKIVSGKTFGVFLILFFLVESFVYSYGWISYSSPKYWFPETPMTYYLKNNLKEGRIVSFLKGPAIPATMSAYGFPVAAGRGSVNPYYKSLLQTISSKIYTSHPTQTYFYKDTNFDSSVWDLIDVRFIITKKRFDPTFLNKFNRMFTVHDFEGGKLIELNQNPTHYKYVADALVMSKEQMVTAFNNNQIDVNRHIIVTNSKFTKDFEKKSDGDNITPGKVLSFEQKSNMFVFKTKTITPGYLLLSSFYNKEWKAFINGKEVKIFPAYGFLSAIKVDDLGFNTIVFRYEPKSLTLGIWFSLTGGLLLMFLLFTQIAIRVKKLRNKYRPMCIKCLI